MRINIDKDLKLASGPGTTDEHRGLIETGYQTRRISTRTLVLRSAPELVARKITEFLTTDPYARLSSSVTTSTTPSACVALIDLNRNA